MLEHTEDEAPADFNTLMQRFVDMLARYADPQSNRNSVLSALVESWDRLTESIINAVLETSPEEMSKLYPVIVQYLSQGQILKPRSSPSVPS